MSFANVFSFVTPLLVGGLTIIGLRIWHKRQKAQGLPPGPFLWPVFGHIPQVISYGKRPLFQIALEWRKKYGDVFLMKMGAVRLVWVSGYEQGKEVLIRRKQEFDYRPVWLTLPRESLRTQGLTYNYGETFMQLKHILAKATLDDGIGDKPLETRIMEEASECIKVLSDIAESGEEVYLERHFKTFFFNLMYGVIFGKSLTYGDPYLSTWVSLIDDMKTLSRTTLLADMIPCLSFLPSTRTSKDLLKKIILARQMIQDSISEHEKTFNPKNPSDVIDLYLEAKRNDSDISVLNVCGLILDTFFANTCGEKFVWLIAYMIGYPDVLSKCRDEIRIFFRRLDFLHHSGKFVLFAKTDNILQVISKERYVTSDDISRLPYTYATMHEALRYGGTQITIPHATTRDTTLNGYTIPRNTIVIVNLASIHLDPELFKDPLEFHPERFLDENGKFTKLDYYNPYGIGTRKCTSWDIADRSLFVFFANIIKRFDFVTPAGHIDLSGIQTAPHIPFKPKLFSVKINKVESSN